MYLPSTFVGGSFWGYRAQSNAEVI